MNNQFPNNSSPYRNQGWGQQTNSHPKQKLTTKQIIARTIFWGTCILTVFFNSFFMCAYLSKKFNGELSEQNQKWVEKMNDTFPDDHFEYVGYSKDYLTGVGDLKNKNMIVVSSEKYPDSEIRIGYYDSEKKYLVTNYNYVRYNEERKDYYDELMREYFKCDDLAINYVTFYKQYSNVNDYDALEFIQHHSVFNISVSLKYEGDFPSQEEITRIIDQIIENEDREVRLVIYLSHTTVHELDNSEGSEDYTLYMDSPTHISYLKRHIVHYDRPDHHDDEIIKIYEDKDVD